ncbi:uncharacterized protein LOC111561634 [Felis catus]|uniref:uncharacterized protein LOC111561634 n=1 Tax=Felis catus TaxID=9685 RepID=UPI000C2FD1DA|nr:uncharacterized protein LOC111561634 [Felis catus]
MAAQGTQTKTQAAGGDPDAAAAAAAAWVCPQPGTRRQRRRRTWQVQRPRSPGGRARPRSSRAAPRGGCRGRLGRSGAEFLNFLGKRRRRRRRRRGAERLRPLPGAFACNPAASGRRRPPHVTSRPLPPLSALRGARAPATEAARRAPRSHWPRPREQATPTYWEPMDARLSSPSASAARAPLLF